jgi:hypothetical protein
MKKRKVPSRNEINIIVDSINFLDTGDRLGRQVANSPLKFVKSFIKNNASLWSEQLAAFPDKFPVLTFTDEQVALIDEKILRKRVARDPV